MDLIVTIVRHGNTFDADTPPRRIGARTDLPLVASGVEQANALGRHFAAEGVAFDQALAAPLKRTRMTIERILACRSRAPAIETANLLTEIDHGPDEGRTEEEVAARIGHAALAAWDSEAHAPADWIADAEQRIAGWRQLWASGRGQVLAVTSNGAARFALLSDEGLRDAALALPTLKLRTGAYGVIACRDGVPQLVAWNRRP